MNKLKLEHLSPYLPYELEALMNIFGDTETKVKIVGLDFECVELDGIRETVTEHFEFHCIKPILKSKTHLHNLQSEILIRWGGGLSGLAKAQWLKEVTDEMLYSAYNSLRYDFVEFMFENHIDVFGLIEDGLAIDENTLK